MDDGRNEVVVNIQVLFSFDFNQQGLKSGTWSACVLQWAGHRIDSVVKAQDTDLQGKGPGCPEEMKQRPHGWSPSSSFFLSLNNCQAVFR